MDSLTFGATLILNKLHLACHISQVKHALTQLIVDSSSRTTAVALVSRFQGHKHLIPNLGSWLADGPNDTFPSREVETILSPMSITEFAAELIIERHIAITILAEIFPPMIELAARAGELGRPPQSQQVYKSL